ncbi:unnamed protein product [Malus baccata var. baccata]
MPRVWTGNEDIRSFSCLIISFLQSLKLLSTMAAIRLDEKPDNIENVLVSSLVDRTEAHKRSNNWLPPPWAIMAMIVLGFNEFMMLLKNPLYLMVLFVAFLLSKALRVHMDITGQFQHGAVSIKLILSVIQYLVIRYRHGNSSLPLRQRRTANVEEVESS